MDLSPKIAPAASVSQVFGVSIFKSQVVESHGEWPMTHILDVGGNTLKYCVCEALPGRYYLLTTTSFLGQWAQGEIFFWKDQ